MFHVCVFPSYESALSKPVRIPSNDHDTANFCLGSVHCQCEYVNIQFAFCRDKFIDWRICVMLLSMLLAGLIDNNTAAVYILATNSLAFDPLLCESFV